MTAVGTALVIGVLLVSGIYSGTVVFCVCLAGALLFLSGLVRLIRSRQYLKKYCSLGEEASDYMVMLQGAYRKKLVNSIVICAVLIMSSIWSFIYSMTEANREFEQSPAIEQLFQVYYRAAEEEEEGEWLLAADILQRVQKASKMKFSSGQVNYFGRILQRLEVKSFRKTRGVYYHVVPVE